MVNETSVWHRRSVTSQRRKITRKTDAMRVVTTTDATVLSFVALYAANAKTTRRTTLYVR